ncbi:hypothetical protein IAR50_007564 [Cryptococcus sp. DSM 104548]
MFSTVSILALVALVPPARASIFTESESKMTFYYDVSETSGGAEACGSSSSDPIGTNNIVAINAATIAADPAMYCGREVQIYNSDGSKFDYSGGALYIWDGCAACESADSAILDLSAPVFVELNGGTCSGTNPAGLSYEILDNYVVDPSVGLGSGYSAEGTVDSATSTADVAATSASSAQPIVSASIGVSVSASIGGEAPSASSSSAAAPVVTSVRTTRYSSTLSAVSSSDAYAAAGESSSSAEQLLADVITSTSTASSSYTASSSSAAQSVAFASTSLTSGSCTYGAWQCDALALQVCNYQSTTTLGWETMETCGSTCEVTNSGSVGCE